MTITATLSGITKGGLMAAAEVHTTDYGGQWFTDIGGYAFTLTRNQAALTITSGVWNPWEVPTLDSARVTVFARHGVHRIVQDVDTHALTGLYCAPEPEMEQ